MRASRMLLAAIAIAAAGAHAGELRTLFHSAEERERLDALRRGEPPHAAAAKRAPPVLGGFVKRSDGRSTVWVNGESQSETSAEAPRIGAAGGEVSVSVGDSPSRVTLKPGEVLDRGNGEVRDVIGDGEINVRRKAP